MSESRKFVLKQSALVLAGVMACVAAMVGVFAMLGKFGWPVVWGGLVGGLLSSGNFFFMAVSFPQTSGSFFHNTDYAFSL